MGKRSCLNGNHLRLEARPPFGRRDAFGISWRRDRDSNPGGACAPDGFQDRCFRPLSHLSVCFDLAVTGLNIFKRSTKGKVQDI